MQCYHRSNIYSMPKSQYFFYGSAEPKTPDSSPYLQFGLYNPVADRFVIVDSDEDCLRKMVVLFANRYHLILCRLDMAKNFQPTLIDNEVALDWTIKDTRNLGRTRYLDFREHLYIVGELAQQTDPLPDQDLLAIDLPYFWAAAHWIKTLKSVRYPTYHVDYVEDEIARGFDLPFVHDDDFDLTAQVYEVIHREFDFFQAQEKMHQLTRNYRYADLTKTDLCLGQIPDLN